MTITVTLTWSEMLLAHHVAAQRQVMNLKNRVANKHGAPEDEGGDVLHIVSCRGEMAVAKAFNLYWSGSVGDYEAVDVGGLIEVRSRTKAWHDLILHPGDNDDLPFVHVDASGAPDMRLVGWLYAREGKRPEYWGDPAGKRPAYFVKQSLLRPIADLFRVLGLPAGRQVWKAGLSPTQATEFGLTASK